MILRNSIEYGTRTYLNCLVFLFVNLLFFSEISAQGCVISAQNDTLCTGDSTTISWSGAYVESCADFDGVNDYLEIVNSAKYNFGANQDFTIEFWIKTTQSTGNRWVITKSGYSVNARWQIGLKNGKVWISLGDGSNNAATSGGVSVANNTWHHVAITYDRSGSSKVYVDAQLQYSLNISSLGSISNSVSIGLGASSYPGGFTHFFDGKLDEVRFWNGLRTQSQIANNRFKLLNPSQHSNLIGYYDFNEASGGAIDCISPQTNGTFNNGASRLTGGAIATTAFDVLWSTSDTAKNITVKPLFSTTYSATSTGWCKYFCEDSIRIEVIDPNIDLLPKDTFICHLKPIYLKPSISSWSSISWSNSSTADSILLGTAGTYWVGVGIGSCIISDTIVVTDDTPAGNLPADFSICKNDSVWLSVQNFTGGNILWSNAAQTDSILVTGKGDYWVEISNGRCSVYDTISILEMDSVLLPKDTSICKNDSVWLSVQNFAGGNILWSNGASADSILVTEGGKYWVEISNGLCSVYDSIYILEMDSTQFFSVNEELCIGESYLVQIPQSNGLVVLWSDGSKSQNRIFTSTGTYWVSRTYPCMQRIDTITLSFVDCTVPKKPYKIYFPNAFTPNGDGLNEYFEIQGVGIAYYSIKISNRWGAQIFESNDIAVSWDGDFKGNKASEGTYYFRVKVLDENGGEHVHEGEINLFR